MFIFVYFFTQTDPTRTVQRSALCRSRRELSNEYLLAKIGVDTAENEPLEVWGENSIQYSLHSLGGVPGPSSDQGYAAQLLHDRPDLVESPLDLGGGGVLIQHLRKEVLEAVHALPEREALVKGLGSAKLANFCKFLAGSFSAVPKQNFARKYAFDSIFQALQVVHTSAPL